jgi:carboxyl-terminal processing protease
MSIITVSPFLQKSALYLFRALAVLGFVVVAVALVLTVQPPPSARSSSSDQDTYQQLSLFGDAFQLIRDEYVEQVEDHTLIVSAINGMLSDLDPHSNYLPAEDFAKMQQHTTGKFGGLGIEITMQDGYVLVITPIDGTPAAEAGIQSGDLIVMIDGKDVLGLTINEAVEMMRGPVGSDISVTIRRDQQDLFDVTLTRDTIKMRAVRHESFSEVGYIRIIRFTDQTTPGLENAVKLLKEEHGDKLDGIILDLRNNPGGLLREAISVVDAFLTKGEIVSTRGRKENQNSRHYASHGDLIDGLPIVVLINSGSASASEIVAGALKDHQRAVIMGTRSFGKGSVQSIIPMAGHGAVRLTTARYYTPSGVSIQSTGIEPDITVNLAIVENLDEGAVREEDLPGALSNTSESSTIIEDNSSDSKELSDYQLSRAIDLIQGIRIFQTLSE